MTTDPARPEERAKNAPSGRDRGEDQLGMVMDSLVRTYVQDGNTDVEAISRKIYSVLSLDHPEQTIEELVEVAVVLMVDRHRVVPDVVINRDAG